MTRTERCAWTIGVLGVLTLVAVRATAQDRVPEVATDWRQLTGTSPGSNPHWLRHFAEYAR